MWIFELLINAGVILGLTRFLPTIKVKDYGTAIVVALAISILNLLIGWLLSILLNIATLGLLTSAVQLVVTAILIKIVDNLMDSFDVEGFVPAIIIAVAIAVVNFMLGM